MLPLGRTFGPYSLSKLCTIQTELDRSAPCGHATQDMKVKVIINHYFVIINDINDHNIDVSII